MKKVSLFFTALCLWLAFGISNMLAQTPNGTYVPITDMAKRLQFAKFVFSGSKVKIYLGMNGISLGVANEYSYSISGKTLSIKEGATSVEYLTYDKTSDQITYSMEASYELLGQFGAMLGNTNGKEVNSKDVADAFKQLGIQPPVWGKEGTNYVPPPLSKPATPQINSAATTACSGSEYAVSWKSVPDADSYLVNWTLNGKTGTSGWINKLEYQYKVPNENGKMTVKVTAKNAGGESEPLILKTDVTETPILATPKAIGVTSIEIEGCNTITLSWESVPNAQFYIINWSLNEMEGTSTVTETQTDLVLPLGDKTLNMYVDVYACANYCNKWIQSSRSLKYLIKIKTKPTPRTSPDGYNPCTYYVPKSRCSEDNNSDANIANSIKEFFMKTINGGSGFIEVSSAATGGQAIKLFGNADGVWLDGNSEFLNNYFGKDFGYGFIAYSDLSRFGKVSVFLKKAGFYASLLNYGTKIIDIISYWSSTGCGESAISWFACEATKVGITKLAGWAVGAAVTASTGGSGIVVSGITKTITEIGVGVVLDKLIDCKP